MICMDDYISRLLHALHKKFAHRLVYMGLQGSYLRGEATENSDIDIMVVIDGLTPADLRVYRDMIESLGDFDKSCGFICSKTDLENWNPLEICHLLHSTKDYYGELKSLIPAYSKQDICNFVKLSINNMYHELCHRYIHADMGKNITHISGTYKGVFFILQNIYYLKTGVFCITKNEMLGMLEEGDKEVMEISMSIASEEEYDFDQAFETLFQWCQRMLSEFTLPENNESGRDRFS